MVSWRCELETASHSRPAAGGGEGRMREGVGGRRRSRREGREGEEGGGGQRDKENRRGN